MDLILIYFYVWKKIVYFDTHTYFGQDINFVPSGVIRNSYKKEWKKINIKVKTQTCSSIKLVSWPAPLYSPGRIIRVVEDRA